MKKQIITLISITLVAINPLWGKTQASLSYGGRENEAIAVEVLMHGTCNCEPATIVTLPHGSRIGVLRKEIAKQLGIDVNKIVLYQGKRELSNDYLVLGVDIRNVKKSCTGEPIRVEKK